MWEGKRPSDDLNFYSLVSLVQCGMWLQEDLEKYLARHGLSYGRFSILLAILESEGKRLSGGEVARAVGVGKATVSKLVAKLLEEGLVELGPGSGDAREKSYRLSAAGRRSLGRVVPGYLERMRIIGANVSPDEKRGLLTILNKLSFLGPGRRLSQLRERPISELAREVEELCARGSPEDIDRVMAYLDEEAELATTKVVDRYLGEVRSLEGMRRIEHYLFHGSQIQRNYATLFFARIDDWRLVDKAYKLGLIDYVQAYSK